jgi:hypothetical protein
LVHVWGIARQANDSRRAGLLISKIESTADEARDGGKPISGVLLKAVRTAVPAPGSMR